MVAIIDYGVGNLFSLCSAFKYLGQEAVVTGDKDVISSADRVLLPGVGAFGDAMEKLCSAGLKDTVKMVAGRGTPLLGVCLGMQMLFEKSEEFGTHEGLGLLKGSVLPMEPALMNAGLSLKVPQIGWNSLIFNKKDCPLLRDISEGSYVYYVHSYYAADCEESLAAGSDYGIYIPGVVWRNNVFGTQFHPEKSGNVGLNILRSFCEVQL